MLKTTYIARASDGLILCETYDSTTDSQLERLKQNAKMLLKKVNTGEQQCTANVDDHCFHYKVKNGVVFMTIADSNYPQKLAFFYLQDLQDSFMEELKNTYGTSGGIDY